MVLIIHQRWLQRVGVKAIPFLYRHCRGVQTTCIKCGGKGLTGKQSSSDHNVSVFERLNRAEPTALTTTQKVMEHSKTTFNLFIIVGGVGIMLYLGYMVISELWGTASPTSVFKMAMKKIKKDERSSAILGANLKGFGDPHSRTRRRLEHQPYEVAGVDYLRVLFHVEGQKRSGVVSCDLKKSKSGWKTRYIILKLDGFPPGKITIEDNRHETDSEDLPDIDYSDIDISSSEDRDNY